MEQVSKWGFSLVGCLCGFGAQSGAVESQNQVTVEKHISEAALPELGGGERGVVPLLCAMPWHSSNS